MRAGLRYLGMAIAFAICAGPAISARAVLTSIDVLDPAGNLITDGATLDDATGLQWLDVTVTTHCDPQSVDPNCGSVLNSVNDILAGAGPGVGWINDGWRYATTAEACDLVGKLGLAPFPCPDTGFATASGTVVRDNHMALLGRVVREASLDWGWAAFDSGGSWAGWLDYRYDNTNTSRVKVAVGEINPSWQCISVPGGTCRQIGHLLVRQAPASEVVPSVGPYAIAVLAILIGGSGAAWSVRGRRG